MPGAYANHAGHTEYMREWREQNRTKSQEHARRQRAKKDGWFRSLKASLKCERCGENHPACLEFHHRDQAKKDCEVSKMVRTSSIERILEEIAKCDVLCSNCHRKLHAAAREAA
jgi:hypothetical protein